MVAVVSDYTPVFTGGAVPYTAQVVTGAVVGGQLLTNAGVGLVSTAVVTDTKVVGVAAHDAAVGAKVTVWPIKNVTHETAAEGVTTVTAGDGLSSGAVGTVKTVVIATGAAAGTLLGTAVSTATGPALVRWIGR